VLLYRKVYTLGKSRAITLPKGWITQVERDGDRLVEVELDVNGDIIVRPHKLISSTLYSKD